MTDTRRPAAEILTASGERADTIIDDVRPHRPVGLAGRSRELVAKWSPRSRRSMAIPDAEDVETRSYPWLWISFVSLVLIPVLAIVVYFAFLASDQYAAEMRFVVRLGQRSTPTLPQGMSAMGGGMPTGGPSLGAEGGSSGSTADGGSSIENAHIVVSYVQSRPMLLDLLKTVDLREIYSRPEADFYARLRRNASMEDLLEYWKDMVSVHLDEMSGIVTLQVRAFRPEDALLLTRKIEALSEALVNQISVRAREDASSRALSEVKRAQTSLFEALKEVEAYRNQEGLIDPAGIAKQTGLLLTKVLAELLEVESQLFAAGKSLSPDSASVRFLQTRANNLKGQAEELRSQLAGTSATTKNIAGAIARYERVMIQQQLAQTLYTIAENGLERARIAAEAQAVYLTVFVAPNLPQDAEFPKRLSLSLSLSFLIFALWSIGVLFSAAVEDHRMG